MHAQKEIILSDACAGAKDREACSRVFFGIMANGLHAVFQTFLDLVDEILANKGLMNNDPVMVQVCDSVTYTGTPSLSPYLAGCCGELTACVSAALCFSMLQHRFADPMWSDIQQLSIHIKDIIYNLIDLHAEAPRERASANDKAMSAAVGFFIAGVVLCNLIYYPAVLGTLNHSIKGTRSLLLLLPEDVVSGVRVLKETVMAITKKLGAYQ